MSPNKDMGGAYPALNRLDTPRAVVLLDRLEMNLQAMADRAEAAGVRLRPHIKTHKCLEIARMQLGAGAGGITASKPGEALCFIRAGFSDLTVAYPLVKADTAAGLLAEAGRFGAELCAIADSHAVLDALQEAAERSGRDLKLYIKIDVGLHRCGLREGDPRIRELAGRISTSKGLELAGILSHAGQAYGQTDFEAVREVAEQERLAMLAVKARLEEDGVAVPEVSVGSTPTELSRESFEGITEIRPGNYVFLDRTQLRLGVCQEADCALFVLATVVSANDDYLIVDAGSKTLSSDAGAHGSGAPGSGLAVPLRGGPGLELVKLSEEHGFLRRDGRDLQVGERLLILPNHACPVANLADELSVVDTAGGCREWKVEARGRNR